MEVDILSRVMIIETDYKKIFHDIVKVFKEFVFDWKNKKVFVKPNILGAFPPEKGVTTHPNVIKAIVTYLLQQEAEVIVGDNTGMPRAYGKNDFAAERTGIIEASCGKYQNIGKETTLVKLQLDGSPEVPISKVVFDCDVFITVPRFKTHLNTIITGGIKNSYGLIAGASKNRFHAKYSDYKRFAELVVSIFQVRRPDLIIMDGIVAMEGDGPNSPDLRDLGKIIASDDALAMDVVMCHMMGIDNRLVDTIKFASDRNLGESDLSKINVIGALERIKDFKPPSTYGKDVSKQSLGDNVVSRIVATGKLKVISRDCILCRQCYESCPAGAIAYDEKKGASIINEKCILCFCCKELCPNNAIALKGAYGVMLKMAG